MTFYSELAEVAVELLTEFGQAVTLTRTTGKSIDPVTGDITAGTSDDQETIGVIKPYSESLIDGTLIQVGDKEAIIMATIAPLTSDRINGMQIIKIIKINPAGTVLVYKVQVRG